MILHCLGTVTKRSVYVCTQMQCVLVYEPSQPTLRYKGMAVQSAISHEGILVHLITIVEEDHHNLKLLSISQVHHVFGVISMFKKIKQHIFNSLII